MESSSSYTLKGFRNSVTSYFFSCHPHRDPFTEGQ